MKRRELWQQIMHYGDFDRMYVLHWGGWPETVTRWEGEGMPKGVDPLAFFDAAHMWVGVGPELFLYPAFPEETLEETDAYVIKRDSDGTINKHLKGASSIPHHIDYTFKSAEDWPAYKKRLQPDPDRLKRVEEGIGFCEQAELRIIGGFNKMVLEKDHAAIDAEIDKHIDLMKEGGFLMMPDHLITPGTPLANYRYYLDRMKALRFR